MASTYSGILKRYDVDTDKYIPICEPAYVELVPDEQDQFIYYFDILSQSGNVLCRQIVDAQQQIQFDSFNHAVVWRLVDNVEGDSPTSHTLAFMFYDQAEEREWKRLYAVKSLEAARKDEFRNVVKANDEEWFFNTYGANEAKDQDVEIEDDDCMDWEYDRLRRVQLSETKEKNSDLSVAMNYNRCFVTRGNQIGVFRHSDDHELEFVASIDEIKNQDGDLITPSKTMLHKGDRHLVMLNPEDTTRVYTMDVEAQKVVQEFNALDEMNIRDISHTSKYAQQTDEDTFVGIGRNCVFSLDPRIDSTNKYAEGKSYQKNPNFSAVKANGDGQVAIGSHSGEIRLFSDVSKKAKTLFPGLGYPIIGLDTTEDGHWVLATTRQFLLLVCTTADRGRTGFDVSLARKKKPIPYKLQLKPEDLARYNITDVDFTPAHFDTGENIDERWIVTSTGPFIVTWNFRLAKQGRINEYKIKRCAETVVADQFRYNMSNEVVVTMPDDVVVESRRRGRR